MSELTDKYFTESVAVFDKALARIANRDMQPPEPSRLESFGVGPARQKSPFGFFDFTDTKQRALLRDHLRLHPADSGLLGDAVNEHSLSGAIEAAFLAGDVEQLGKLVDRAFREHLGAAYVRTRGGV